MLMVFVGVTLFCFSRKYHLRVIGKAVMLVLLRIWMLLFLVGGLPAVFPYDLLGQVLTCGFFVGLAGFAL